MNFQSVENLSDIKRIVDRTIETNKPYALDIETTGLNPWRDEIVGLSLAYSGEGAIYVPLRHRYGQPFDPKFALPLLQLLFESVPAYIFNIPFDAEFLRQAGIKLHPDSIDVSLLTYVNGTLVSNSLAAHAEDLLRFKVWSYSEFMENANLPKGTHDISEAPIGAVTEYCGRDAVATFLLKELLWNKLKMNNIYQLEASLLPITMRMRRNGVLIDKEHFETEAKRIEEERKHLQNIIWQQASEAIGEPTKFNIRSTKQKSDILFNRMKLPVGMRSKKTQNPSTSADALAELKWKYPVVWNMINHSEMVKMLSSYLDKFPALIEKDGRIHASFNQTGVVAGRYSSSDPNLQNIPRLTEWILKGDSNETVTVNARNAFRVPDGWGWASYDYSQIEARIAAGVTKEVILLNSFRDGVDFHTKTASLVFGVPVEQVTKTQRYMGKTLNFLLLYGGEARGLFRQLIKERAVTYGEAKKYKELYYNAYPRMFREAERIGKDAYMTHSVTTIFGRQVPVPLLAHADPYYRKKGERQAYNGKIQGSAADILKRSLVDMDAMVNKHYGYDNAKVFLTVHDSQDYELSPDLMKEKKEFIRDSLKVLETDMEGFPKIYAEAAIGDRWGNLEDVKDLDSLSRNKVVVGAVPAKSQTFVLEVPSFEKVSKSQAELAEFKSYVTSKVGENVLVLKVGENEIVYSKTGICIEDRDKLILLMNGKFYEKLKEEELKDL